MGGVADPPVQRLAARVELVTVAQTETPEVELRHPRKLAVASYVCPDAEHFFDEDEGRGLRLWPQVLRIRHQHARTEVEVRAHREQRARRQVVHVAEVVTAV